MRTRRPARAVSRSSTGTKGILRYRGYPIEQLAEESTFLETAYLVVYGQLPTASQLDEWTHNITTHTMLHENIKKFMEGFRHDAHPMGMLLGTLGALSTFYPDAKNVSDTDSRELQTYRAIAKMPTIAAFAYRHGAGLPYIYPDNDLTYAGNFLNMVFHPMAESRYRSDPAIQRAIDILFILHADHEQNCSTNVMRDIGSSQAPIPSRHCQVPAARSMVHCTGEPTKRLSACFGRLGRLKSAGGHKDIQARRRETHGLRPSCV